MAIFTDCPICLDEMKPGDIQHPLNCPTKCGYNFCASCVSHLISSSKCDYEEASDGSRQVKVQLICPQCRSDLSGTIYETLRCRRRVLAEEYQDRSDDQLTAKELRLKYEYNKDISSPTSISQQNNGSSSHELFPEDSSSFDGPSSSTAEEELDVDDSGPHIDIALFGGLQSAMTEDEQLYVTELMTSGDVDRVAQATQILSGIMDMNRRGITPSQRLANAGAGAGTASGGGGGGGSTTNNNNTRPGAARNARVDSRGRTAASRNLRHGYSSSVAVGRAIAMSRTTEEKKRDKIQKRIDEYRAQHPLPSRMPRQVTLDIHMNADSPGHRKFPLTFIDDEWDGSISDAFTRVCIARNNRVKRTNPDKRTMEVLVRNGYANNTTTTRPVAHRRDDDDDDEDHTALMGGGGESGSTTTKSRVLVATSKGQAAKMGIRTGDVVTHLNGERFVGNAGDLFRALQDVIDREDSPHAASSAAGGGGAGAAGGGRRTGGAASALPPPKTFSLVLNADRPTVEAIRRRVVPPTASRR